MRDDVDQAHPQNEPWGLNELKHRTKMATADDNIDAFAWMKRLDFDRIFIN